MSKKMDIVYILGTGSRWLNNEIRYSLRSVEKYCPHNKIFVIGEKPDWMKNVVHVEAVDGFPHKIKNAIHKIRTACFDPRISDQFILMNDDFFFLRSIDPLPTYHLGPLTVAIRDHTTKAGYYYQSLQKTRDVLQAAGFENPTNYEVHFPIIFDKKKFLKMTEMIDWHDTGYLFRSIYGNIFDLGGQKRKDVKAYHLSELNAYKVGDLLSTCDSVVLAPQFQKWLMEKFPEPSQYEDYQLAPEALIK